MTVPAMVMYLTSCIIFCCVVIILLTCKVMGLMDSDPGQRLTPAREENISNIAPLAATLTLNVLFKYLSKQLELCLSNI